MNDQARVHCAHASAGFVEWTKARLAELELAQLLHLAKYFPLSDWKTHFPLACLIGVHCE
jgi:hypothetical protein